MKFLWCNLVHLKRLSWLNEISFLQGCVWHEMYLTHWWILVSFTWALVVNLLSLTETSFDSCDFWFWYAVRKVHSRMVHIQRLKVCDQSDQIIKYIIRNIKLFKCHYNDANTEAMELPITVLQTVNLLLGHFTRPLYWQKSKEFNKPSDLSVTPSRYFKDWIKC